MERKVYVLGSVFGIELVAVNHELLCQCMFASLAQVQFYYVNGNANDIVV